MNARRKLILKTSLLLSPVLIVSSCVWYRETHRPQVQAYKPSDLTGQIIVTTGATSGIGRASAKALRDLGATIINGSRSDGSLDLSDLSSVKRFAKKIKEGQKCDIILAYAAEIYTDPDKRSVDGYDATFATNHLGLQALLSELSEDNVRVF